MVQPNPPPARIMLTAHRARELFDYDEISGDLIWSARSRHRAHCIGRVAGHIDGEGYRRVKVDDKEYRAHRVVWLWVRGSWPMTELDHIDRDRLNNRIANLRETTRQQNCLNRDFSKARGVKRAHKSRSERWMATITVNQRSIHLGTFNTETAAHAAYQRARVQYFGA